MLNQLRTEDAGERVNAPVDLVRALRPHQWIKSAFVFVGLIFSHRWTDVALAARVLLAAGAFAFVASCTYVFNDIADIDKDRIHPAKRKRPLPAGEVTSDAALIAGGASLIVGLALATMASSRVLVLVLAYFVLTLFYTYRLKDVVLLDVFIIAAGFMLRILAGTVGVGIKPSGWLLQCGLMIALFLGFAKRRAELTALADEGSAHRRVLRHYTPVLLDKYIGITAAAVIMSYALYTVDRQTVRAHGTPYLIYTVPFIVFGIFRYVFLLHNGSGGDPARDLFRDRQLQAAVSGWFVLTVWLLAG